MHQARTTYWMIMQGELNCKECCNYLGGPKDKPCGMYYMLPMERENGCPGFNVQAPVQQPDPIPNPVPTVPRYTFVRQALEQLEKCGYKTEDGLHDLGMNDAFLWLKENVVQIDMGLLMMRSFEDLIEGMVKKP